MKIRNLVVLAAAAIAAAALPTTAGAATPQLLTVPPQVSNGVTQTFEFTLATATLYECNVDGAGFNTCTSPTTLTGLAEGDHSFAVRATYPVAQPDMCIPMPPGPDMCFPMPPIPTLSEVATFAFKIDRTKPVVSITGGPAHRSASKQRSAAFVFSDDAGSTFSCTFDKRSPEPCESPLTIAYLSVGVHKLTITPTDTAGNAGDPLTRIFAVNTSKKTFKIISDTKAKRCVKRAGKKRCKKINI